MRSKAYSRGGIWICFPLWDTELTDTEKCLIALIDGLTDKEGPCHYFDRELAGMMKLTRARTQIMLEDLTRRRYVIELWPGEGLVCRVAAPEVSSKPATVRRWIKAYRREFECEDNSPLPITKVSLPS